MLVTREVGTMAFASNSKVKLEIPVDSPVERIGIEMIGTVTCSGTSTTPGALNEDGILNLLSNVILKENGSEGIAEIPGPALYHIARLMGGSPDVLVQPALAAGANSFRVMFWLPAVLLRSLISKATTLRVRPNGQRPGSLYLDIQCGDATGATTTKDDLVNAASTWTRATVATLTIHVEEHQGIPGEYHRKITNSIHKDLSSASAGEIRIPLIQGNVLRRVVLLVRDNSLRDDALVNTVELKANNNITLLSLPFTQLQSENCNRYGCELSSGLPPVTGLAVIDRDYDGLMGQVIDTSTLSILEVVLDIDAPTGTASVEVITEELELNPNAPAIR